MKYKVTVETLSPLHIGSGVELLANYDYKALAGSDLTYVFDQDAIYANEFAQRGEKANLAQPAASLITDLANLDAKYLRYTLKGSASLERLHAQMKDVYGGVYVPGSSLKGAIRNALMTYAASQHEFSVDELGSEAKSAAEAWGKDIFGDSPWSDILRVLQVADSQPVNPPPLEVLPVRVVVSAKDDEGSPIEVEAVSAGASFETTINLDELTLQYASDPRLDWTDRQRGLLANLLLILQAVGKRRVSTELAAMRERGFSNVIHFYEDLVAKAASAEYGNSALLQIGWGTGWEGMTIGEVLEKPVVNYLRERYQLGKPPDWNEREKGPWRPDLSKSFPKSRRLSGDNLPQSPLGWVKITLIPEGEPRMKPVWGSMQEIASHGIEPMGQFASVTDVKMADRSQPQKPKPADIVWWFSAERLPLPGDQFQDIAFTDGKEFFISIPGLDFDTEAYGVLLKTDQPGSGDIEDGRSVRAEVLEVQKEAGGRLRVRCKVL